MNSVLKARIFTQKPVGKLLWSYRDRVSQGGVSLPEAYKAVGYLEEWDFKEFRGSVELTRDQALIDTFRNFLAGARNHLRIFAARSNSLGHAYQAQMLKQREVDAICSDFEAIPGAGFSINPGLNDAWYFPDTDGQGFLITVYPNLQTVFVAWFTFDTELPGANAPNELGNAGQRWLTAQGNYVGGQAELSVYSSSDGHFDMGTPRPKLKQIGSLLLQFEDCAHGSVFYEESTQYRHSANSRIHLSSHRCWHSGDKRLPLMAPVVSEKPGFVLDQRT